MGGLFNRRLTGDPQWRRRRGCCRMVVVLACLALVACDGARSLEPVGIGPGRDDLKRSPCACHELRQDYGRWTVS